MSRGEYDDVIYNCMWDSSSQLKGLFDYDYTLFRFFMKNKRLIGRLIREN